MKKKILIISTVVVAILLASLLVACVPNADKAKENLEKAGYVVVMNKNDSDCEAVVSATKASIGTSGVSGEHITIYYFKDAATAKEKYESIEKKIGKDSSIKRSGKVIYYGTEQAIKDMK